MEEDKTSLEQRVGKLSGILEEIRARLNHLESEIDSLRQEMGNLHQEMQTQFRWTIGILLTILIPMWISIILAVVFT